MVSNVNLYPYSLDSQMTRSGSEDESDDNLAPRRRARRVRRDMQQSPPARDDREVGPARTREVTPSPAQHNRNNKQARRPQQSTPVRRRAVQADTSGRPPVC